MVCEQKEIMGMRKRIYEIIEPGFEGDKYTDGYDIGMIIVILCSFVPLLFKTETPLLRVLDIGTAAIFAVDYILRWITADLKFGKPGAVSFLKYPFSPMAIIDLLSILPILLLVVSPAFKLFRLTRLFLALRTLRLLRIYRYSKNLQIITNVFRKQKQAFILILILTVGYIFVSAVILFQVEPEIFNNFFDAIYWAVILLTTVGYGDVLATTLLGKLITILSALLGIALVALPAGLIVAGYQREVQEEKEDPGDLTFLAVKKKPADHKADHKKEE